MEEEANTDTAMEALFDNEKKESTELVVTPMPDDDFEYVKQNIRGAIEKGNVALSELLEIARDSGHPRAFEVFTTLMAAIVTANKDLIETKETAQKIDQRSDAKDKPTINNNLILTTADLAKLLDQHKN
jgi:hypothetical protein